MIKTFNDLEEFKKILKEKESDLNLDIFINVDIPYFEQHENFTIISMPEYEKDNEREILFLSKKNILFFSRDKIIFNEKRFKNLLSQKYGESTIIIFLSLKKVLKTYIKEFEKIRSKMNDLDINPISEQIENVGKGLRLLTDRLESLVHIILNLKEIELKEFNTEVIQFDYELLMSKSRYELERCRSHMYRISSLRAKAEMKSNNELNITMKKLTVIMTFLTIVSIVVSVPGTIGAILGIPALSNAYFQEYTLELVWVLISLTLLSILLGYLYWKSLKMN